MNENASPQRGKIQNLLETSQVGVLSTLNIDGTPYCVPVHFVYEDHKFYVHGLPKGQKVENLQRNSNVGFCVYDLQQYLLPEQNNPCNVNTKYKSVIVTGTATMVENHAIKKQMLQKIVAKYTPQFRDLPLPDASVLCTGLIEITATTLTGKYYE